MRIPRLTSALMGGALVLSCAFVSHAVAAVHTCRDASGKVVTIGQFPCPASPMGAASAAEARRAEAVVNAMSKATREQRQLLTRYPDRSAHVRAEMADIDAIAAKIRSASKRYGALVELRKPLEEERQFHPKPPLPLKLQSDLDASDSSFLALHDVFDGLRRDIETTVEHYQVERKLMAPLWRALGEAAKL